MRTMSVVLLVVAFASLVSAAPIRVALMDFQDQTGLPADQLMGGAIKPGALAEKGAYLIGKGLVGKEGFELIDRRDFIAQVEKLQPTDSGKLTPTRPTFIQAAQALRADAVLRGSILSFSTGKQVVDQGGYKTEFTKLTARVSVEALDPNNGAVIAMADGSAQENVRQTAETYTVLSEDEALSVVDKALAQALPKIETALQQRQATAASRPMVKISVKTSADPAMIEIDGILVGTSPMEGYAIYQGDHVLTVGKPGYRDITKRIMFEKDSSIEVPMMRTELSAEEEKEVLEKARLDIISSGIEPAIVIKTIE